MDGLIRRSLTKPAVLLVALAGGAVPVTLVLHAISARPDPAVTYPAPGIDPGLGAGAGERPGGKAASGTRAATRPAHEAQARAATLVRWRGSGGWGAGTRYQRVYDPARDVTVRGRMVRLEQVRPFVEMGPGVQALVATDRGLVRVHLGPRWFLEQQDAPLRSGSRVEVTGAAALLGRRGVLIASEVRSEGRVLKLRDGLGLPFWSWARHPQPPEAEE